MEALKSSRTLAVSDLAAAAEAGVARAVESRKAAGVELTDADVDQVTGGVAANIKLQPGIICGRIPIDPLIATAVTNPATNPTLPAGGLQGVGGGLAV